MKLFDWWCTLAGVVLVLLAFACSSPKPVSGGHILRPLPAPRNITDAEGSHANDVPDTVMAVMSGTISVSLATSGERSDPTGREGTLLKAGRDDRHEVGSSDSRGYRALHRRNPHHQGAQPSRMSGRLARLGGTDRWIGPVWHIDRHGERWVIFGSLTRFCAYRASDRYRIDYITGTLHEICFWSIKRQAQIVLPDDD